MEFQNWNLTGKTRHYYRVNTYVSAHTKEGDLENSYCHSELFDTGNLLRDREEATRYFENNLRDYSGKFIHPLGRPIDYGKKEFSSYSITLYLVEDFDGEEIEYPLLGEADSEVKEGLELEAALMKEKGFPW